MKSFVFVCILSMRKSLFSSLSYSLDNMTTSIAQSRSCGGADSVFYRHTNSKQRTAEALAAQHRPQPNVPDMEVRFAHKFSRLKKNLSYMRFIFSRISPPNKLLFFIALLHPWTHFHFLIIYHGVVHGAWGGSDFTTAW